MGNAVYPFFKMIEKFEELYKKLNAAQREAVDAVEGPVMVVAGPGTGKTQILTLRIANILQKTDALPDSILALTFTESGVVSMRRRLAEIIGSPAYSVVISTFHGFCNDIIKNYPEEFPHIIGSSSITEVDQITMLEEAIEALPLKLLKPYGDVFYYLRAILAGVNDLKREGVAPEAFEKIMKKEMTEFEETPDLYHVKGAHKGKMKGEYQEELKRIKKGEELALVYAHYQGALKKSKRYDYSDMIMEVLKALETNKDLLLILQERHQYILVDEHQDTNTAQNRIIELLANFHANPNVFVVGDEKQAIFRFQGASLENFLYFKKLYPEAKLVVLEENYRSTQMILDSAHSVLAGEKKLNANVPHGNVKIQVAAFGRPEGEYYFLAKEIEKKIAEGVAPREIAVLYRDNKDAFPIAKMLKKCGIPFAIESDQDLLNDHDIKKLILLLRAVQEFGSEERFIEALHVDFLHINPLDIYKLMRAAREAKCSVFDALQRADAGVFSDIEKMREVSSKTASWKTLSKNVNLPDFFEVLVRESGFLAYALSHADPVSELDKLNGFFDEIKKLVEAHRDYGLGEFLDYLGTLTTHKVLIKKAKTSHMAEQVRLMTAHKSKGLEFEYVYIANAYDGHWGNKRRAELLPLPVRVFFISGAEDKPAVSRGATNDDERRLFYVALTRAKKSVTISYAKEGENGREQLPSQFLSEMDQGLVEQVEVKEYEAKLAGEREIMFAPSKLAPVDVKSREFIAELFLKNGLSVTALNNYLRCPWHYFYTNLLRIPRAPEKHQMYGMAIHAALKDFFDALKERVPEKELLLLKFSHYLQEQPLREKDMAECKERGLIALGGYYDCYVGKWHTNTRAEFNIAGIMLAPEIRLTGKIDKIEILDDGRSVNVVDYKTGKPKTRGEVEGTTQSSNGDMKRQLTFYKLLLSKYEDGKKFKMVSGDIDFVEPDEKGRYKKENVVISDAEVVALEEQIKEISSKILNVEFWNETCGEKDCEFCALRAMMK